MPADEDTDEKLLGTESESEGESGRRWSGSTDSKDATGGGGGGGVVADAGSLVRVREDTAELVGGTTAAGGMEGGLGCGLGVLGSAAAAAASLEGSGSVAGGTEPKRIGRAVGWKRGQDVEALWQPTVTRGNDGDRFLSGDDGRSNERKSWKGFEVRAGLETVGGEIDLAAVRSGIFVLPVFMEGDGEGNGEVPPGRTQEGMPRSQVDLLG